MASMKSTSSKLLLLPDVYDIAKKVGEEFQRIIGEFGGNCVATLVPTVVDALEYLEIYVEEYQALQAQNYKLLLENDNLMTERELRMRLAAENEELLKHSQEGEREERRLSQQVDRLQLKNEELLRKIDRVKHKRDQNTSQDAGPVPNPEAIHHSEHSEEEEFMENAGNGVSDSVFNSWGPSTDFTRRHQSDSDMMEGPRMYRRLSQVDMQLEKAKRKLNFLEQSCEKLNMENCKLKAQVEEYRAEAALKTLQDSTDSPEVQDERDTPKFYKRDLITVLRERNELKEELDSLRDELAMAKAELKKHESYRMGHRRRSDSRVREILDTLTESIQSDIPSLPLTPLIQKS